MWQRTESGAAALAEEREYAGAGRQQRMPVHTAQRLIVIEPAMSPNTKPLVVSDQKSVSEPSARTAEPYQLKFRQFFEHPQTINIGE